MASCRLTNSLREDIAKKLMAHKFESRVSALVEKQANFALTVYNDVYSEKQCKQMEELPKGWLPHSAYIKVQFGRQDRYAQLNFDGSNHVYNFRSYFYFKSPADVERRVPDEDKSKTVKLYEETDNLSKHYELLKDEREALENEVKEASKAINGTLNSVTTVNALIKAWPEIKPFIPVYALQQNKGSNLPALPTQRLNTMFGLPIEDAA